MIFCIQASVVQAVILLSALPHVFSTCVCDDGAAVPGGSKDNVWCYKFSTTATTYVDAKAFCTLSHQMFVPESPDQNMEVSDMVVNSKSKSYWLGMTDSVTEGTWVRTSGGAYDTTAYYENFATTQPTPTEDCVTLVPDEQDHNGRKWRYTSCTSLHYAACRTACYSTIPRDAFYRIMPRLDQKETCLRALRTPWDTWDNLYSRCSAVTPFVVDSAPITSMNDFHRYQQLAVRHSTDFWTGLNDNDADGIWVNDDYTTPALDTSEIHLIDSPASSQAIRVKQIYNYPRAHSTTESISLLCYSDCPCTSNPCQNGATCHLNVDVNGWTCVCALGWEGTDCTARSATRWELKADGLCYGSSPMLLTWLEGWNFCASQGFNYAKLTTAAEQTAVIEVMAASTAADSFWLGGASLSGSWKWTDGSSINTALYFNPSEPNNPTGEPCIHVYKSTSLMNDIPCNYQYPAICVKTPPTDVCLSAPCQNSGVCNSLHCHDEYTCTCDPLYSGVHCDIAIACISDPCMNQGTCTVDNAGAYQCACPTAFEGNECQTEITSCVKLGGTTDNYPYHLIHAYRYKWRSSPSTYSDAKTYCEGLHAASQLFMPDNRFEHVMLTEVQLLGKGGISADKSWWLGATDQVTEGTYLLPDGSAWSSNTHFLPSYSSLDAKDCLEMSKIDAGSEGSKIESVDCTDSTAHALCRIPCNVISWHMPLLRATQDQGKCFRVASGNVAWTAAAAACAALSPTATLAPLRKLDDYRAFVAYAHSTGLHMWTGLNDQDGDGIWSNIDGTVPAMSSSSIEGATSGQCGLINLGKTSLYADSCTDRLAMALCMSDCPCASNPCGNGGTCKMTTSMDGYSCLCMIGFGGTNCETPTSSVYTDWQLMTENNRCMGASDSVPNFWDAWYTCTSIGHELYSVSDQADFDALLAKRPGATQRGWLGGQKFGQNSGAWTNHDSTPVTTDSSHWDGGAGSYPVLGWDGSTLTSTYASTYTRAAICEKAPLDLCASEPCQNGGTCIVATMCDEEYTCTCEPTFTGINCETEDNSCLSAPCQNGGTCTVAVGGDYQCECPTPTSGDECQTVLSTCTCHTGHSHLIAPDTRTENKMNQYCYSFKTANVDQPSAESECQADHVSSHLFMPHDEYENIAVAEFYQYAYAVRTFWLGATDAVTEGTYMLFNGEHWDDSTHYTPSSMIYNTKDGMVTRYDILASDGPQWNSYDRLSVGPKAICRHPCNNPTQYVDLWSKTVDRNKCFRVSTVLGPWTSASAACGALSPSAVLAPVRTADDVAAYRQYAQSMNTKLWTALNDQDGDTSWTNVDGTTDILSTTEIDGVAPGQCGLIDNNNVKLTSVSCSSQIAWALCMSECPCASSPCQNGGTCHMNDNVDGYQCICMVGFAGTDCSSSDAATFAWTMQASGKCYGSTTKSMSWWEAWNFCVKQGPDTNLASVTSATDKTDLGAYVSALSPTPAYAWGGLNDMTSDDTWAGWTDGSSVSGSYWAGGQPSGDAEYDCVYIKTDGKLSDLPCMGVTAGDSVPICQRTVTNVCASTPCQYGGTCNQDTCETTYTCNCKPSFGGTHCEIDVVCASYPCQNGATCAFNSGTAAYECTCVAGYTGQNCETDPDECSSVPCQNSRPCSNQLGSYSCDCGTAYEGVNCETEKNECDSDPCQNGGTCANLLDAFSCACTEGWTAADCSQSIDDCTSGPCQNSGVCVDGHIAYTCTCPAAWTGVHCEIDFDECSSSPCAYCLPCTDLTGSFQCDCSGSGYEGATCASKSTYCGSNPCQNSGTCNEFLTHYSCSCPTGFTGSKCQNEANPCNPNPCNNNGTCTKLTTSTYSCDCSAVNFKGPNCENEDVCTTSNPCSNGGTCTAHNDYKDYTCACRWGWTGRTCTTDLVTTAETLGNGECSQDHGWATCTTITNMTYASCYTYVRSLADDDWVPGEFAVFDGNKCCVRGSDKTTSDSLDKNDKDGECTTDCEGDTSTKCGKNNRYEVFDMPLDSWTDYCALMVCLFGTCINEPTEGLCLCPAGKTGLLCESSIDDCAGDPCTNGGTCIDGDQTYTCNCLTAEGYSGDQCQTFNECASNPCQNGGSCADLNNKFQCYCPLEWNGDLCDSANDCNCNNCTNGATCVDGDDTYDCACVLGFTGEYCETEIDECVSAPCREDSTCHDFIAFFECECQAGFTGQMCETNIDDCRSDPCQHGAGCNDGVVLYWCDCVLGYTGYDCETDIDECESNPCVDVATCQDFVARYFCYCEPGYSGPMCLDDVDECSSDPCQNGATCNNLKNHYTCYCVPGFSGYDCQIDIDECSSYPCQHGASCNDLINHFTCTCDIGWTSTHCEIEIDECQSVICYNGGSCNDFIGWFNCSCNAGFTDYLCETDIDECASTPCEYFDVCYEGVDVWWCDCTIGYTDTNCQTELDECISEPCQFNATCNDHIAQYDCTCDAGYTGYDCEQEIDECWSNPCQYYGTCNDYIAYYTCDCIAGITGLDCEINIDECLSTPCNEMDSNATCTDLINGYNCTCLPEWTETHCNLETSIWEILQLFKNGALSDLSALRDVVAQSSLIVDSVPFIVATMPESARPELSWNTNDSVVWCTYEGKSCITEEDIVTSSDPVQGNCFTFNDETLAHYKISRSGQGQGLLMYLDAQQSVYAPWVDVGGMRVYIHNQSDSVYAESVSYAITPGYFTTIGLRWKEFRRMGAPYGNCIQDRSEAKDFYYDGTYSADGCIRSCYQNEVKTACECMDPRYPSPEGEAVCGLNQRRCVNTFIDEKGDPGQWEGCDCPLPCYNGEYDVVLARTRFREKPLKCQSLNDTAAAQCILEQKTNLIKLEVYLEDYSYIVFSETPRYTFEALLSNIGGQMGLLCGMSVFSIAEILFTLLQLIMVTITGKGI